MLGQTSGAGLFASRAVGECGCDTSSGFGRLAQEVLISRRPLASKPMIRFFRLNKR
jgi:hypothetical protein